MSEFLERAVKITTVRDLQRFFESCPDSGRTILVETKIRRWWLTCNTYILRQGKHYDIIFEDKKAGVWEAHLERSIR